MYTILIICDDLKKIKFDLRKGSLVQRIVKKIFIVCCVLVGISAWCITPGQSLTKKGVENLIKINKERYIPYIESLAKKWSVYRMSGPLGKFGMQIMCTASEVHHAGAAGAFLENKVRVKKEARAIGTQKYDIDYMHDLIKYYKQQGSNAKDLPRILHEKNVEHLSLPANVTQSTLKRYPDKLSTLVKTGQINAPRYYRNVALNIFLRFLIEKKISF